MYRKISNSLLFLVFACIDVEELKEEERQPAPPKAGRSAESFYKVIGHVDT